MIDSDLSQLNREELIQLVVALSEQVTSLTALVAKLQADNKALRLKLEKDQKPPTDSSNSSQPPSRDQKRNRPADRAPGRHGPPAGHAKFERPWVAQPDHIVVVKAACCQECQTDLHNELGCLVHIHQITELPVAAAEVIEVRQYVVVCPGCGQEQRPAPPAGLELGRVFGARLEATVVYYRQTQHMSYERTIQALHDLHQVEISQGGIDQIMQRAGQQAAQAVVPLTEAVRESAVVYSDETGGRVAGDNWWQWVFSTATAVLHVMRFDRSSDVIKEVFGQKSVVVWVSDLYLPQMQALAEFHQICLAHQLRNLQAVVDQTPQAFWPRAMQALFRASIHLHHERLGLAPPAFERQRQRLERICDWLLKRSLSEKEAKRLLRRYCKYRASLFVFLQRTDVDPTNNRSEHNLRPSVIHRKVLGSFRSEWGAHAYTALASVIGTAALTGLDAFEAIQNLIGTPALPLCSIR
jgi:transposase